MNEVDQSNQIADTITAIQAMVERKSEQLKTIKKEKKLQKEMISSALDNDTEYSKLLAQYEKIKQELKLRKEEVVNSLPGIKEKIAELGEDQKELEEDISSQLCEYFLLTGSKAIDTSDGDQADFVIKAKL